MSNFVGVFERIIKKKKKPEETTLMKLKNLHLRMISFDTCQDTCNDCVVGRVIKENHGKRIHRVIFNKQTLDQETFMLTYGVRILTALLCCLCVVRFTG